jgi:hypothetical protein
MIKDLKRAKERAHRSAKGMGTAPPTVGSETGKYSKKRAVQRTVFTKK